jgi:hypothetical protein
MPLAPLRAISYTSAGGAFSVIDEFDQPVSAFMKVGYEAHSGNVYTNKVVLLDEAHNLVRTQTRYGDQLQRLRDLLQGARRLVLAGFTGTPILEDPAEGRLMLDLIKCSEASRGDEGYISSFQARPRPQFPEVLPHGLPDGLLTVARVRQLVQKVELCGEALRAYETKRRLGFTDQRLRNYCNVCVSARSFHDGKNSSKARLLANPENCCPKLFATAQAVATSSEKALVLTRRTSGHMVMLELMRQVAHESRTRFGVATIDELEDFNHVSNLRGERYRVLVADAEQCCEGVNFLAVRRTYLTDVPGSPSSFVQQCGRAIRMYGHRGLPEKEQLVVTQIYVSTFPKWMRNPLACWSMKVHCLGHCSGEVVEQRARLLAGRLRRAGINTLGELRDRVGKHCQKSATRQNRTELSTKGVAAFLEEYNLWEEVRLLRTHETREAERVAAAREENGDLSAVKAKPHALVPMLQSLCAASSTDDMERFSCVDTVDEVAMQELVKRTEDFASALATLREVAIDRDIFKHFNDAPVIVQCNDGGSVSKRMRLRGKQPPPTRRPQQPLSKCHHDHSAFKHLDAAPATKESNSGGSVSKRMRLCGKQPPPIKRPHHSPSKRQRLDPSVLNNVRVPRRVCRTAHQGGG